MQIFYQPKKGGLWEKCKILNKSQISQILMDFPGGGGNNKLFK